MTTGKTIALTRWTFVDKVMSLLFNMLSRLVITFLLRSKCLLISWLQSPSAVILESRKIKSATVSTVSPSICHEVMGPDAMILVFWILSFKPTFSLSYFTFIKRLFSSSLLSAISMVSYAYLRYWYSPSNLDSSLCFIQPSISHDVLYCPLFKTHSNWKYRERTSGTQVHFCNSTWNLGSCSWSSTVSQQHGDKCFLLTWTTSYSKYLVLLQWWEFGTQVRTQAGKAFEVVP